MGGQIGAAGVAGIGAAGAALGAKGRGHRTTDSGVGTNRDRSSSAISSDYEYAADQKVKKNQLGGLSSGVGGQVV